MSLPRHCLKNFSSASLLAISTLCFRVPLTARKFFYRARGWLIRERYLLPNRYLSSIPRSQYMIGENRLLRAVFRSPQAVLRPLLAYSNTHSNTPTHKISNILRSFMLSYKNVPLCSNYSLALILSGSKRGIF